AHWKSIKKATPTAFFDNLAPHAADGFFRQAFVLCHMMLPRGKRELGDVARAVSAIFDRNLAAWHEDLYTFTNGVGMKRRGQSPKKKPAANKKVATGKARRSGKRTVAR